MYWTRPMKKIYEKDRLYDLLLPYINRSFRWSYRSVEYRNLSAIPTDGAVIFAPNHANCLMDALAVLSIDNRRKVFVARADIFRQPLLRKVLTFLKILPISRMRDGKEALASNGPVIGECVEALCHGVPFCILPEGRHRPKHSLLPLKKGIARIAFEAYRRQEGKMKLSIVPVGLEYGDYFDFRSTLLVNIGRPIDIGDFLAANEERSVPEKERRLLLELDGRLRESFLCLPDDESYDGLWEMTNLASAREYPRPESLYDRMLWMQKIAARLGKSRPELLEKARGFSERRRSHGIRLDSVALRSSIGWLVARGLFLLLSLPFFLLATVLLSPALAIIGFIRRSLQDKTFLNSIRYVVCYLLYPLLLTLVCLFLLFWLPWWAVLGIYVCGWLSTTVWYDWTAGIRNLVSDIRFRRSEKGLVTQFL